MYDVFLFAPGADRELVRVVREGLTEAGLTCYTEDGILTAAFAGADPLAQCKVYLLVVTEGLHSCALTHLASVGEAGAREAQGRLRIALLNFTTMLTDNTIPTDPAEQLVYSHTRGLQQVMGAVGADGLPTAKCLGALVDRIKRLI